jgi:hypothetical protein
VCFPIGLFRLRTPIPIPESNFVRLGFTCSYDGNVWEKEAWHSIEPVPTLPEVNVAGYGGFEGTESIKCVVPPGQEAYFHVVSTTEHGMYEGSFSGFLEDVP